MKTKFILIISIACFINFFCVKAQLTPNEAIIQMGRGINVGNTMEATPTEGSWGNYFRKVFFR